MITFNNLNLLTSIKDDIILVDKTVYKLYSYYFNSDKIIQIKKYNWKSKKSKKKR